MRFSRFSKVAVIFKATFFLNLFAGLAFSASSLSDDHSLINQNDEDFIELKPVDVSVVLKDTSKLKMPSRLACEGDNIYIFDRETGLLWKHSPNKPPESLFKVQGKYDKTTINNISVKNGRVVMAGLDKIYIYDDKLQTINNIYRMKCCVQDNSNNIYGICKSNYGAIKNVNDYVVHIFDPQFKHVKGLGIPFLKYNYLDKMLKSFYKMDIINDKLLICHGLITKAALLDINSGDQEVFDINVPNTTDILNSNVEKIKEASNKGHFSGKLNTLLFYVVQYDTFYYMLCADRNSGYVIEFNDDKFVRTYNVKIDRHKYGIENALAITEQDKQKYFIIIYAGLTDNNIRVFTE